MRKRYKNMLIVCIGLLLVSTAFGKDLSVRYRVTETGADGSTEKQYEIGTYWAGSLYVSDEPSMRKIIDAKEETITIVRKTERIYRVTTFQELRDQMKGMQAATEQHLEELPPDQRKLGEALVAHQREEEKRARYEATGRTETIAGYDAREYVLDYGPYRVSVWTTETIVPPPNPLTSLFGDAFDAMLVPGRGAFEGIHAIDGLPLRTISESKMDGIKGISTSEAIEVKEQAPPPEMLQVPEGYVRGTYHKVPTMTSVTIDAAGVCGRLCESHGGVSGYEYAGQLTCRCRSGDSFTEPADASP
jgi:hypothetical protein